MYPGHCWQTTLQHLDRPKTGLQPGSRSGIPTCSGTATWRNKSAPSMTTWGVLETYRSHVKSSRYVAFLQVYPNYERTWSWYCTAYDASRGIRYAIPASLYVIHTSVARIKRSCYTRRKLNGVLRSSPHHSHELQLHSDVRARTEAVKPGQAKPL